MLDFYGIHVGKYTIIYIPYISILRNSMLKFYLSPKQTIYRYIVNIDTMVPYGSYGNLPSQLGGPKEGQGLSIDRG